MKKKNLALAIACALAPVGSYAAEASESVDLGTVVVTAPTMSDPLTVTTDPKAPRQPVPAADGADFLKNIPGFSVVRKGGTSGDPVLRGLTGSRLNILQDGAEVLGGCPNRMDPPTAYLYPQSFDVVEVIKGPSTVLYGGGNLAGTVLFERRTERFEEAGTRFFLSGLVGSHGRNDQVVDATVGAPEGFARLIGTRSESDDYEDGDGNRVHSAYYRWSGTAIAGWTPNDDTRLELTVERSDGEAAYADRSMDGVVFDRDGYSLKFEKAGLSPTVNKVEAQLYHQYVDHVMDNFSLRTRPMMMSRMVNNPDRETDGARASVELELSSATWATIGADYRTDEHTARMDNDSDGVLALGPRMDDLSFRQAGVFAQLEHQASMRDSWIGGLRVDRVEATAEMMIGPVAAGTEDEDTNQGAFIRYEHQYDSPFTVFAGLGHAERSPDYWERKTDFTLAPEKSTQLDLGFSYLKGPVSGNLSAFYAEIDDYILVDWGMVPMKGFQRIGARNVEASTYGFEGDVTWAFARNWAVTGTVAYVRGENDTDNVPLAQIPPLEATLALDYDNGYWLAGLLARGVAEQDRVSLNSGSIAGRDLGPTPGFSVFSVHAGYRPTPNVKLTAGIDNLFDRTYAEHLSRSGDDVMISGYTQTDRVNEPGRVYWLQASVGF